MKPISHSKKRILLALAVFLVPVAAWAHPGHGPGSGFVSGLVHPISGLDHILAMIAVGLWAAQLGGRALFFLPLSFVAALGLGSFLGFSGTPLLAVPPMILASVFLLGFFLCLSWRPRLRVGMIWVAVFGLVHGHAHGTEVPVSASGLVYGLGFVLASLALHGLGLGAGVVLENAGRSSQKILLRLAGIPVLAGGLLLLAI